MNQYANNPNPYGLTDGELAILQLLYKGHSAVEVASIRCVSKNTIATQKTRGLQKIGVSFEEARPVIEAIPINQRYCKICKQALEEM